MERRLFVAGWLIDRLLELILMLRLCVGSFYTLWLLKMETCGPNCGPVEWDGLAFLQGTS